MVVMKLYVQENIPGQESEWEVVVKGEAQDYELVRHAIKSWERERKFRKKGR